MKKLLKEWRKFMNEEFSDVGWTAGSSGKHWGNAGSGILLVTPGKDKCFLLLRGPEVAEPNTWGIPGGAIPEDEETGQMKDPWKSAVTELQEECGSLPPGFPAQGKLFQNDVDENFTFYNYVVIVPEEAVTQWKVRLDWENQGSGWFTPDDLPSPLHFGTKWLLSKLGVS